jgi:hypothetical protein
MFSLSCVVVAWGSKKQPTAAQSSTEAEYQVATIVICEAIWLPQLLRDLQIEVPTPILIYSDNVVELLRACV